MSCLFPESAVEAWSIVMYMQTSDLTLREADHSQLLPFKLFSVQIVDVNGLSLCGLYESQAGTI